MMTDDKSCVFVLRTPVGTFRSIAYPLHTGVFGDDRMLFRYHEDFGKQLENNEELCILWEGDRDRYFGENVLRNSVLDVERVGDKTLRSNDDPLKWLEDFELSQNEIDTIEMNEAVNDIRALAIKNPKFLDWATNEQKELLAQYLVIVRKNGFPSNSGGTA